MAALPPDAEEKPSFIDLIFLSKSFTSFNSGALSIFTLSFNKLKSNDLLSFSFSLLFLSF